LIRLQHFIYTYVVCLHFSQAYRFDKFHYDAVGQMVRLVFLVPVVSNYNGHPYQRQ